MLLALLLLGAATAPLASCAGPARTGPQATQRFGPGSVTAETVNAKLLGFADDHVLRVIEATDAVSAQCTDVDQRSVVNALSLRNAQATFAIATSPNPIAGLTDMVVMVSLTKEAIRRRAIDRTLSEAQRLQPESYRVSPEALDGMFSPEDRILYRAISDSDRDVRALAESVFWPEQIAQLDRLLESPFTLFPWLLERIAAEAELAQAGKPAHIIFKINALIEPQAIQALYRASQAGVKIDLIVRSMCSLRPGIPGVSDNIRVRSVVGRFLEHTRVYCFGNGGEELVYLGSADLRERNLFQRVEVVFPVDDEAQRARVCEELQLYLADNTQAWELDADGAYRRVQPAADAQPVSAQATLLARIAS